MPKKNPKRKAKKAPKRKTSSSTEEEEEVAAELLVPDSKSVSSRPSRRTGDRVSESGEVVRSDNIRYRSPDFKAKQKNAASLIDEKEEVLLEALEGKSGGGREAVNARRLGVPDLLKDIAAAGGTDIVGKPNSKERKTAENRVRYLIKLGEKQYNKILEHNKVTPFRFRVEKPARKQPPKIITANYRDYRDKDTSILSSDDESTQPSTQASSRSNRYSKMPPTSKTAGAIEKLTPGEKPYPHFEKVGSLTKEHIYVDVDCLENTPAPYKFYEADNLEAADPDKFGTSYTGYRLEMTIDQREIKKHEELKNDEGKVIRPVIPAFKYECFIREDDIVLRVPFQAWEDRGNDDHLLREKYQDTDPGFKQYMDGRDAYRKKLIERFGADKYQSAHKNVVFHFHSSEDPNRRFEFSTSDLKVNENKEENHMKIQLKLYEVEGDEYEETRLVQNEDDTGMDTDQTKTESVTVYETAKHCRLFFYVADLAMNVKRSGPDEFKNKPSEDDEFAAAMMADAQISSSTKRRKKRGGDDFEAELEKTLKEAEKDLKNAKDKGLLNGGKRDQTERDGISIDEKNFVAEVLAMLPDDARRHVETLPENLREGWLVSYLNARANELPVLQRTAVLGQKTNTQKFAKLWEFHKARHMKGDKRSKNG